jgi:hypothetical protein
MGRKLSAPLTIWVFKPWLGRPEVLELLAKGHNVVPMEGEPDLILHPAAHRWNDLMWDFWPAVKSVIRDILRGKRAV